MRDRVSLKRLDRWSEAKMRELFLVPNYPCPMAARVGEWGEGGKWLCNIFPFMGNFHRHTVQAHPQLAPADPSSAFAAGFASRLQTSPRPTVVYSVGSRDETSFEHAMYQLLGVKPVTLDPSLSDDKQAHLKTLDFLEFHNLGLKGRSGRRSMRGWGQLMRITQAMGLFNHSYIDVLKIDCEVEPPRPSLRPALPLSFFTYGTRVRTAFSANSDVVHRVLSAQDHGPSSVRSTLVTLFPLPGTAFHSL